MKIILCNSAEISEQQLLIYGNIRNFMQVKTLFSHVFTAKPQFQLLCYLFLLSFDFTAKPQCNNGANYIYFHLILLPNRSADEFYKKNHQQLYCWCKYILHIYFLPYRSYKSVSTYLINLHKQHSEFTLLVIRIFCVTEYATKEKKEQTCPGRRESSAYSKNIDTEKTSKQKI